MACSTCSERDNEAVKITKNVVLWDVAQRKQYLRAVGPVMCVFEVYNDFFAYSSGVYSHVSGGLAGLHCVEVIGYNELGGYWICKNSWGTGWGDGGYFNIAYGQCGIDSTYPFWGIGGTKWYLP
jgi:C1A family cysteine protease